MATDKLKPNHWYKIGRQSLAVYARNAGFDLAIYDEYSAAIQREIRKKTVQEAMCSIEQSCRQQGFELSEIDKGVYVISLANPLSIQYPSGRSQVIYVGRGNIYNRVKSHFEHKLFDFMLSVAGADFDFYFARPTRAGTADYFHHVEHTMLNWFSSQYRDENEKVRWPLMNKISGAKKNYAPDLKEWWKKPLKASGKTPLWEMKPTNFNAFKLD